MSLFGLPAQVIDRLLGTTASRPVPPFDTNGHADFDDTPVWARNGLTRSVVIGGARLEADVDAVSAADFGRFAARFRAAMRDEQLAAPYANCDVAEMRRVAGRLRARIKVLGRQYGRASRTIGEQRGTIASLRAQLKAALGDNPAWPELMHQETPGAPLVDGETGKPGQVDGDDHQVAGTPAGAEAGEGAAPAGTDRERRADRVRDELARALAASIYGDSAQPERWDESNYPSSLRAFWRDCADAVIDAGWLPPRPEPFDRHVDRVGGDLAALGLLKPPRGVVVQVLTDHELLADDTCRCGWGTRHYITRRDDPLSDDNPLWHAEHVAAQLALQGVVP